MIRRVVRPQLTRAVYGVVATKVKRISDNHDVDMYASWITITELSMVVARSEILDQPRGLVCMVVRPQFFQ